MKITNKINSLFKKMRDTLSLLGWRKCANVVIVFPGVVFPEDYGGKTDYLYYGILPRNFAENAVQSAYKHGMGEIETILLSGGWAVSLDDLQSGKITASKIVVNNGRVITIVIFGNLRCAEFIFDEQSLGEW